MGQSPTEPELLGRKLLYLRLDVPFGESLQQLDSIIIEWKASLAEKEEKVQYHVFNSP